MYVCIIHAYSRSIKSHSQRNIRLQVGIILFGHIILFLFMFLDYQRMYKIMLETIHCTYENIKPLHFCLLDVGI